MPDPRTDDEARAGRVARSPALAEATVTGPGATLRVQPPMARFILRGPAEAASACSLVLGATPSADPCRAVAAGRAAALWLGPDEWLLLLPAGTSDAMAGCLGDAAGALVEVSHRQVALHLDGPRAAEILNAACPLDLHDRHFPVGMCTRTVFGKAEIVLWRTAPQGFHLEVWRSFAGYVHALLAEAMAELRASSTSAA